jgi:type II secretory pathway component PulF
MSKTRSINFRTKMAFPIAVRSAFYADMASFMSADIPPYQALVRMEVIARKRSKTRRVANIYKSTIRAMDRGVPLAKAVAPWVPGSEAVMMVGAETAGPLVLQQAFGELSVLLERQQKAKKKLVKTLFSSGMSLAAIIGVMYFIAKMVIPQLKISMTPDMAARMTFAPYYFAFGTAFIKYGVYVLIGFILLAIAIITTMGRWTKSRRWWSRRWFDAHLIPWTLYARTQATFFLATTSSMMRAGIPMKAVVTDMVPFASIWMKAHLRRLLRDLEAGRSEVDAMGTGILPSDTSDRLKVYALMKDFTGIMTRLSDDNFVVFEESIDKIGGVLHTVSLFLLVSFAVSTMVAIFDYSTALQASVSAIKTGT